MLDSITASSGAYVRGSSTAAQAIPSSLPHRRWSDASKTANVTSRHAPGAVSVAGMLDVLAIWSSKVIGSPGLNHPAPWLMRSLTDNAVRNGPHSPAPGAAPLGPDPPSHAAVTAAAIRVSATVFTPLK